MPSEFNVSVMLFASLGKWVCKSSAQSEVYVKYVIRMTQEFSEMNFLARRATENDPVSFKFPDRQRRVSVAILLEKLIIFQWEILESCETTIKLTMYVDLP